MPRKNSDAEGQDAQATPSSPGLVRARNVSTTTLPNATGHPFAPFSDDDLTPEQFERYDRLGLVVASPQGGTSN